MRFPNILKIATSSLVLSACANDGPCGECRIHGTLPSDKWDGEYVYFVPMYDVKETGMDSAKITGNEFNLSTTKSTLYDIRLSWRTRFGLQRLLLATEPGDVAVTIDSISFGGGTPQNDSLQAWKDRTADYRLAAAALSTAYNNFYAAGDSVAGDAVKAQAKAARAAYRQATERMADSMPGTPVAKFLNGMVLGREKLDK